MSNPSLDGLLAVPNLPSLPTVATRVLELTRDSRTTLDEIGAVVQNDPALASRILRTVNSSYYGLSSPCPTVGRACGLLGLDTVKSLVLGFSLTDLSRRDRGGLDLVEYWRRCIYSAAAARRIALVSGVCDPEEAFTAALLQDIGMLALDTALGPRYRSLVDSAEADHGRLAGLEREALGFHHGQAGAKLGERWRLPQTIIDPIRCHHRLDDSEAPDDSLVLVVTLAFRMYNALILPDGGRPWEAVTSISADVLGLDGLSLRTLLEEISDQAAQLRNLLDIDAGSVPRLAEARGEALVAHHRQLDENRRRLEQRNRELSREASTDGLTGLANRGRFDAALSSRFDAARRMKGSVGLILADVDHFKALNDIHGHQAGDAVLRGLARRLEAGVGERGLACRYGGEEFAVIVAGLDRRGVARLAEGLRRSVAEAPFEVAGRAASGPIPVTASFGAAILDAASGGALGSPARLLRAADRALYAAKRAGRNCVRVFREKKLNAER